MMSDHADPKPEETDEAQEEAPENKPLGLIQYPPPPGQTPYGTYQHRH